MREPGLIARSVAAVTAVFTVSFLVAFGLFMVVYTAAD